jgi:hypothetical protein
MRVVEDVVLEHDGSIPAKVIERRGRAEIEIATSAHDLATDNPAYLEGLLHIIKFGNESLRIAMRDGQVKSIDSQKIHAAGPLVSSLQEL